MHLMLVAMVITVTMYSIIVVSVEVYTVERVQQRDILC